MTLRAQIVLGLTAAALLVTVPGVPGAVRAPVAVAFLCLAPGLAWVRWLPIDRWVEQLAAAVAGSIALAVLVAEATMFAHVPGLWPAALVLAGITVAGALLDRVPEEVAA